MKKVEIILGNEKHVLVPDDVNFVCCEEGCSLYAFCCKLRVVSLCIVMQDSEDCVTNHFIQVPLKETL